MGYPAKFGGCVYAWMTLKIAPQKVSSLGLQHLGPGYGRPSKNPPLP